MCVISCNSDHFNEDARAMDLTWENGRDPSFRSRPGGLEGRQPRGAGAELERTQALPYATYPGLVSQRGSKEGIYSGYNAFTTSRNSLEHGISGQLRPAAATGSTVTATGDEMTRVMPKLKPVDVLTAETLSLCNNLFSHQIMQPTHIPR